MISGHDSAMAGSPRFVFYLSLILSAMVCTAYDQQPPTISAPASVAPAPTLDYPDNAGGLERLAKDILKAKKEGDTTRAATLIRSLAVPDAGSSYLKIFGPSAAANEGKIYEANVDGVLKQLDKFFSDALQGQFTDVIAQRFDKTCDDNASDTTFGILQSRLEPVPLYELRLASGFHFHRLWILVYVDGGFRFLLQPKFPDHFPEPPEINPDSISKMSNKDSAELEKRTKLAGALQAAKLISRVNPEYPSQARGEKLQGTVHLHAIIGKNGSVRRLRVLNGTCSLAQSSFEAVKKWRYSPTTLFGQPIEVDTTIDVIFRLNP
jgi:TonB family protein